MTTIDGGISIYGSRGGSVIALPKQAGNIAQAPEKLYQQYVKSAERFLKSQYLRPEGAGDSARNQNFVTIELNGKTVATIDNNGFVKSSNQIGAKLRHLFANEDKNMSGPALAEARAHKIAEYLGGKAVKSSTALNQAQYEAASASRAVVDHAALKQDPFYAQLQKTKEARTLFLAQQYGAQAPQETPPANGT